MFHVKHGFPQCNILYRVTLIIFYISIRLKNKSYKYVRKKDFVKNCKISMFIITI